MESIEYWEGVSTRRLLATSLHELSTTLPPNADTKLIFHVYLRWIETHRLHENKYTVHWEKTLLQWSQSLGSRGYSEIEIEQQISTYKNAQLDYENRHNGRKLPSTEDIAKAFDEMIPASNGHGRSWQGTVVNQNLQNGLENEEVDGRSKNSNPFQHESRSKQYKKAEKAGNSNNSPHANHGVPQKNYICSRCHRKGHFLQACPTNLDPSYDSPPSSEYECKICGAIGKHYLSLCPLNKDPQSIFQKRRGLEPILPSRRHRNDLFIRYEKEPDQCHTLRLNEWKSDRGQWSEPRAESRNSRSKVKLQSSAKEPASADKEVGELIEQGIDTLFRRADQQRHESISSREGGKRRRGITSENKFGRILMEDTPTTSHLHKKVKSGEGLKADYESKVLFAVQSDPLANQDYEIMIDMSDTSEDEMSDRQSMSNPFSKKLALYKCDLKTEVSSDAAGSESDIEMLASPFSPPKVYSDLVNGFILRYPRMTEVVHPFAHRATALELWSYFSNTE